MRCLSCAPHVTLLRCLCHLSVQFYAAEALARMEAGADGVHAKAEAGRLPPTCFHETRGRGGALKRTKLFFGARCEDLLMTTFLSTESKSDTCCPMPRVLLGLIVAGETLVLEMQRMVTARLCAEKQSGRRAGVADASCGCAADLWTAAQAADPTSRRAAGVRLDVPHAPIWMQTLAEKPLVQAGFVPEGFFDAWVSRPSQPLANNRW